MALKKAASFIKDYMHPEVFFIDSGTGKCANATDHWYATAKAYYNDASMANGREMFQSERNSICFENFTARLNAWATAAGDTLTLDNVYVANTMIDTQLGVENNSIVIIIVLSCVLAVVVGGSLIYIKKRKTIK